MTREISSKNEIGMYLHCRRCTEEIKDGTAEKNAGHPVSPQQYRRYDVGFTPLGLQVWCTRHDLNIVHIDFEGQKHPVNTSG